MTLRSKRSAIVILGMHRSGTSALSRLVSLSGWELPKTLIRPSEANETGHWEAISVVGINNQILAALDRQWADPKPIEKDWSERGEIKPFRDKARDALVREFGGADRIVIKDPRLSKLLPLWTDALSDLNYAIRVFIACRNPLEVASSLDKRDGMKRFHALLLWQSHLLEAEHNSRSFPRAIIHYDNLIAGWQQCFSTAMEAIGENFSLDRAVTERGASFLDTSLRHYTISDEAVFESSFVATPFKNLYERLRRGSIDVDRVDFDLLRRNWRAAWKGRSSGTGGSRFAANLPLNMLQQSRKAAKAGQPDRAIALAQKAIEAKPSISRHHHYLGTLLARFGKPEAAVESFARAIELYPRAAQYYHDKSEVLRKLGRLEEAVLAAEQALAIEPHRIDLSLHLAKLLSSAARFDESESAFDNALENEGNEYNTIRPYVALLWRLGKMSKLNDILQDYAHRNPAEFQLHVDIAETLLVLGRPEKAFEAQIRAAALACEEIGMSPSQADEDSRLSALVAINMENSRKHCDAVLTLLSWWRAMGLSKSLLEGPRRDGAASVSGKSWPVGYDKPKFETRKLKKKLRFAIRRRPLISIMIPVFNVARSQWLRDCLDSILAEEMAEKDIEIVIVDDASDDSLARDIGAAYGTRISYVRNNQNLGLLENHNRCLELARGKFVHVMHQDDFIYSGFYESLIGPLRTDDRLVATFSRTRIVDENGDFVSDQPRLMPEAGPVENFGTMIAGRQLVMFPSIIVRRSAYLKAGGFSPSSTFAFDWEMWSRIGALGGIWFDPSILSVHRVHPHSATNSLMALERLVDGLRVAAVNVERADDRLQPHILTVAINRLLAREWRSIVRQVSADRNVNIASDIWALLLGRVDSEKTRGQIFRLLVGE